MKHLIIIAITCLIAIHTTAQSSDKFNTAMGSALAKMATAKSPDELTNVVNTLERIAQAEPKEWLPLYYIAFTHVTNAFSQKDPKEIDALVAKAEASITKAESISPKNDEIMVLKAMCSSASIMADPMARGMKKGIEAASLLEQAKLINANNPRIYLMQAQSAFYTPEQFGGSKKLAQSLAAKALALYNEAKPSSPLMPSWGKEQVEQLLTNFK
jgi:hypothetical protein